MRRGSSAARPGFASRSSRCSRGSAREAPIAYSRRATTPRRSLPGIMALSRAGSASSRRRSSSIGGGRRSSRRRDCRAILPASSASRTSTRARMWRDCSRPSPGFEAPAVLRVVGAGPELDRLRSLAARLRLQDRVEFAGHVSYARLAAEYRRATVFCLPSRQEGFGIVFLEAMAAGLPIVAARAGAAPEVLAGGDCGVLVPPGDSTALAAALDGLLDQPTRRVRLAEAGLARVRRFDAPAVAGEFLDAIGVSEISQRREGQAPPLIWNDLSSSGFS